MTNLFAYRTKSPKLMKQVQDPIGPENDKYLRDIAYQEADLIICCWGKDGEYLSRGRDVIWLLQSSGLSNKIKCLGITKNQKPVHPLYIPKDRALINYQICKYTR